MDGAPFVLHICSDFAKQKVYSELVSHLDRLGVSQFVYVPVRSASELDVNRAEILARADYRYAHILRPRHRLMFRSKVRTVFRDLSRFVDLERAQIVHAHFLFSDGAVALQLLRSRGIPYLTAVRNTDVNAFLRLRPDLRPLCWEIIENAARIIFITPAYREVLLRAAPAGPRRSLESKSAIIPNGVAQRWLDRRPAARARDVTHLRLLYVGDFSKNKNIPGAVRAAALVNERRPILFTLVGAAGDGEEEVDRLLRGGRYPFVQRIGRIDDPTQLEAIYRSHDVFIMPSFRETFGVVYIEALSQGLPVIHSRGQGIDGYFASGTVSEAVDPGNEIEMRDAILAVAGRLDDVWRRCVDEAGLFSWTLIAERYRSLYEEIAEIAQMAPA
jgi:glycosyltransferase involved in cell wall biosynthesis